MAVAGLCQGLVIAIAAIAIAIPQPRRWPAAGSGAAQATEQYLHISLGSGQLAVMRKGGLHQPIQLRVVVQRPPILRQRLRMRAGGTAQFDVGPRCRCQRPALVKLATRPAQ
ncbi:hypothetical protein D3C79_947570 [compost metagenome]